MELDYFSQTAALKRNAYSVDKFNYIYLMCLVLFLLVALLYTWRGLYISKVKCDIREAEQANAQVSQVNRRLRLERVSLVSLAQIEHQAKKRLGLVVPRPEQVVIIEQEWP